MNPKSRAVVIVVILLLAKVARAATFEFEGQRITVPEGFVVERVAGPGLVDRPITADFDEEGRLYVAESSGSNDPVKKQLEEKPHRIVRLEDSDGDGVFDRKVVFADRMMFPAGTMWLDGSLYVTAPPSIWKLTDTDGDGVADRREEWYDAKTLTGCANDLHGPYLGPDGWIYWCKGAFAKQTHELPTGEKFETRAAHIFRRRPEGGGVEPVMTGGMDNPVDVVFTPEGERIFTTTFFQHPGGGQRDGLIHGIYGGHYGKVHDVLDDHPTTGGLLPVLTHLGPAAPSGLARYESEVFGREYRDNLFAALFNLHKITRHELVPKGATYGTMDSDFLVSDSTDFHPTDVIEDADGSLLVIDTGGWYKLCCPTSQLWKPDVLGAIYRVRRDGGDRVEDARGLKVDWQAKGAELAKLLGDERPAVRNRAVRELGKRGEEAVEALADVISESDSAEVRRNAIWALTQIDAPGARENVRRGIFDESASVRRTALHSVSVWRDRGAFRQVSRALYDQNPAVKRVAAEAAGRMGANTGLLLQEAAKAAESGSEADRVLEHSLIYAVIEGGAPAEAWKWVTSHSYETRAALIALDQMRNGGLSAGEVIPFLNSPHTALRETANWIAERHPEWGQALAGHYERRLQETGGDEGEELARGLSRLGESREIRELIGRVAGSAGSSLAAREAAFRAMEFARVKEAPGAWIEAIDRALESSSPQLIGRAISAAGSLGEKMPEVLVNALREIAANGALPVEQRLDALAATVGRELDDELVQLVLGEMHSEKPGRSGKAVRVLSEAKLSGPQLMMLAEKLEEATPLQIGRLLQAFGKSSSEEVGKALVGNLEKAKSLSSVHPEQLMAVLANYSEAVKEQGKKLARSLNQEMEKQLAHINELLPELGDGDIRRGQAIFNSTRAACSSCHAIGYLGGDYGPDLTRIGQIRTERDLLEAVVYPSASFVRSYEPVVVITRDEEEYSGILRKDGADEVVIATGPEVEVRLAREEISEMRPGRVSAMPQGLDQQLTKQEMADLLAFLKATRW